MCTLILQIGKTLAERQADHLNNISTITSCFDDYVLTVSKSLQAISRLLQMLRVRRKKLLYILKKLLDGAGPQWEKSDHSTRYKIDSKRSLVYLTDVNIQKGLETL